MIDYSTDFPGIWTRIGTIMNWQTSPQRALSTLSTEYHWLVEQHNKLLSESK